MSNVFLGVEQGRVLVELLAVVRGDLRSALLKSGMVNVTPLTIDHLFFL